MGGTIQLVLPGLFDLPLGELEPGLQGDQLPALNRLLRFATPRRNGAFSIDAILQAALAPEASTRPAAKGLPLAQAVASPQPDEPHRLLLFRAVHLQPDLYSAIVVPIPESTENLNDIDIIINDLRVLFNVDCDISTVADGLFLMRLREIDAPTHYPHILSVLGKAANPYIEQSRATLPWYKLLNEMQMFLHQHPLNQGRVARGLRPINSLWCWGGGTQLPVVARPAWYCDDLVLNRFAESLQLATAPLRSVAGLSAKDDVVVVDLRLMELLKTGIAAEPGELLREIDAGILQPLSSAARRDRKSLRLRAGYELDFELTPLAGLKFWRRPRGLDTWLARREDP
ncbi:MAG: hypothetical protein OEN02_04115 [Gammaproteobacteria bacterium]|nr:hypothetical protein [Gammaproteobacteria bacterium]MDH3387069.1 hypothetical protein [Gammaproteobacteria bacterium]